MRLHWAWIIFKKEMKETLRDRRSLFLMVILPLLLYPLLFRASNALMFRHWSSLSTRTTTVGVLGKISHKITDALSSKSIANIKVLPIKLASRSEPGNCDNARQLLSEKKVDVILQSHNQINCGAYSNSVTDMAIAETGDNDFQILFDGADDFSAWSATRIEKVFKEISRDLLRQRLEAAGLSPGLADPFQISLANIADKKRMGGHLAGRLLPLLLVLMVLLGTFYPSLELTAGERERGTFETLSSMPVRATEIIIGKYFTVVAIAIISASVNLIAMGIAFSNMRVLEPSAFQLHLIDQSSAASGIILTASMVVKLFFLLIIPVLFFSSLMLAAATLAKNLKEGQNLLTPVFLMCIMPVALVCSPGGFELNLALAIVPVVNVALLIKGVLMGDAVSRFVLPILIVNSGCAVLMLVFATRCFQNEQLMWDKNYWKRFLNKFNSVRSR